MAEDWGAEPGLQVVDRSSLERYSICPMQGRLYDTVVKSASLIAASGTEVHRAISETIAYYINTYGDPNPPGQTELTDYLRTRLRESRPDVQPDVLDACSRAAWAFITYLRRIAAKNILAFDGGETLGRSGQLAMDLDTLPIQITAELDCLHTTPSPEVVQNIDYKSGNKYWTERDVADAFQFQKHAVLVFHHYPPVECVRTTIFNTRSNTFTYAVEFTRDRLPDYAMRIKTAADEWYRWNVLQPKADPPAWPARDKCDKCDAVGICPAVDRDLAMDPADQLTQLVLLNTRADAIKKRLSERVKETGKDIVAPDGTCFGWFSAPKSTKKPIAKVYTAGKPTEDD